MKNNSLAKALKMIRTLSQDEQNVIVAEIIAKMGGELPQEPQKEDPARCDSIVIEARPHRPDCPHCGAKSDLGYVVKDGKKRGKQCYRCKACGRKFVPTTNTAFAHTKKSADTWRQYIAMMIAGKSIAACAEACDICIQTAFEWRHKILNAFVVNQNGTKMTGNVELDEMLIPISYKGNHVQGGFGTRKKADEAINDMPREAYKRGTDNISRSSKDKSCVFCMVQDGNKGFYAAVPGVGFMTNDMLDATVAKHVDKDKSMLLADNYKITQKYFEQNGYAHTILLSNISDNPKGHKPEIRGDLHLQHVNAMHHHIRTFLKPYYGVSSKYLSHYMAFYVWLKHVRLTKQRKPIEKVSIARAAMPDCYISRNTLRSRPAVPICA